MKLELKHIPQIAYGLEIQILNSKCDYVGIERAVVNGHYYIGDVLYLKYEGGSTGKSQNECKLILRPMSDLNNMIEINGFKFIPIDFLESAFPKIAAPPVMNDCSVNIEGFEEWQQLFMWHFDVSGLIEKGLAIDINTL